MDLLVFLDSKARSKKVEFGHTLEIVTLLETLSPALWLKQDCAGRLLNQRSDDREHWSHGLDTIFLELSSFWKVCDGNREGSHCCSQSVKYSYTVRLRGSESEEGTGTSCFSAVILGALRTALDHGSSWFAYSAECGARIELQPCTPRF